MGHPKSPLGKGTWVPTKLSTATSALAGDLERELEELETFVAGQPAAFLDALPDAELQQTFRGWVDSGRSSKTGETPEQIASSLLETLASQIKWFCATSRDRPNENELWALLESRHLIGRYGTARAPSETLARARLLAGAFFEAATGSVRRQWAEARRLGNQERILNLWRSQLQSLRLRSGGGGGGRESTENDGQNAAGDQGAAGRSDRSSSESNALKTWIEFHLVDEDGQPVPNATYRVTLPNGSTRDGRLDAQGTARFEEIDIGQCRITFTELEPTEWRVR